MTVETAPLIAHIIYRLGIGGLENGLVNLVNASPSRYRHAIVCLAGHTDFAKRLRSDAVGLHDLGKQPGKDPGCYLRLYRLLRRLRPSIVHTRNYAALDCQAVAGLAGIRCRIHGEHGWEAFDLDGTLTRHVRLRRLTRPLIDRYVTVSRHMEAWLENVIEVPPERIRQIYNGTDTARFRPATAGEKRGRKGFRVGSIGRLDPIKDHRTLLGACVSLLQASPALREQLRVVLVGDGATRPALLRQVEEADLSDVVEFAGARDDVPEILRSFDLFVLPSLNEGISNTILEAMASGLPVVATRVGGNPEIVEDGVTGTLVEPGRPQVLADALLHYIGDEKLVRTHGSAGRRRVMERFALSEMTDNYYSLYDECLGIPAAAQSEVG